MTEKEQLAILISNKGNCFGTELDCTSCPLWQNLDDERVGCLAGNIAFEQSVRFADVSTIRYSEAVKYFVKKYGKEDLVEILL